MRIVSITDLVCDIYYDEDLSIIGAFGGMSACNIVCNLKHMGLDAFVYGACGNDYLGKICIDSLNDCNVGNDIKLIDNLNTKAYHILKKVENGKKVFRSVKYCPYCKKNSWYDNSYIDVEYILKNIMNDDILLFDNLNSSNQYIIDNTVNIKLLDLGTYNELIELDNQMIIQKMANKFTIINMNERVEKYLIERFNCDNAKELSDIIKAKLLIVTRGINGNDFIYDSKVYSFPLDKVINEIDDSGAGDAFFSIIIKNWLKDQEFNPQRFSYWINDTKKLIEKVLMLIGSRTYIKDLYKVEKRDICEKI